jgi:chorismate synthase
MIVENRDWKNWAERDIPPMPAPRSGHANLTGTIKFGYDDFCNASFALCSAK